MELDWSESGSQALVRCPFRDLTWQLRGKTPPPTMCSEQPGHQKSNKDSSYELHIYRDTQFCVNPGRQVQRKQSPRDEAGARGPTWRIVNGEWHLGACLRAHGQLPARGWDGFPWPPSRDSREEARMSPEIPPAFSFGDSDIRKIQTVSK